MHDLDLTDPLDARALASLALARSETGADILREEALLASQLGYSRHAWDLAASLPADDPVRLYLHEGTDELRALAEKEDAEPLTRYLYLLRLAATRDSEAWRSWVDLFAPGPPLSGSILRTGFLVSRPSLSGSIGPVFPYVVLMETWAASGRGSDLDAVASFRGRYERELKDAIVEIDEEFGERPADLARAFHEALGGIPDRHPGSVLDAPALRAYFVGQYYGAMYRWMRRLLSSAPHAREFANGLREAPEPIGREIYRWYDHLVLSEAGSGDPDDLGEDLSQLGCLGAAPSMRTFEELEEHLDLGDLRRFAAAKSVGRRLDTRPAHQAYYAEVARVRYDIRARERHYANVVALAAPTQRNIESWLARFVADTAALKAMVENRDLAIETRMDALGYLIEAKMADDDYIRRNFGHLIELDPVRWDTRESYLKYLEGVGAYVEGADLIRDWLFYNRGSERYDFFTAQTALARMYYMQGENRRAYQVIRVVIQKSGTAGGVGRAALIVQRLGRHAEARNLARWGVRRYPNFPYSRAVLAEVLWKQGRYGDVPSVLHDPRFPLSGWAWRGEIADAFLSAFGDKPIEEAENAFAVIVRTGIPAWFSEALPMGLSDRGRPDLAFVLQAQLKPTRVIGSYRLPIRAYLYLKAWKGQEEALVWIRPRIPRAILSRVSRVMYGEGAEDLLWELVEETEATSHPDILWLTRAAAFVRSGDASRAGELTEHYRTVREGDYEAMGRYLLGFESEEKLLGLATTAERRCQIAYYIGLKAQSQGRYIDAADWYRVVLETGEHERYEYAFAQGTLEKWRNSAESLEVIARSASR